MPLEHQDARQAAHPVDVREAGCGLRRSGVIVRRRDFTRRRAALQSRLAHDATTQRTLGTLGLWAVLCFIGGLYASWHGYGGREFAATLTTFAFFFAVLLLFAARGVTGISHIAFRRGQRVSAGHDGHSWIPDLRRRHKYFWVCACRGGRGVDFRAAGIGRICRTRGTRCVAGLPDASGDVGGREIFAVPLAVAVSRRPPGVCVHRAAVGECGDRDVPSCPARRRSRATRSAGDTDGGLIFSAASPPSARS